MKGYDNAMPSTKSSSYDSHSTQRKPSHNPIDEDYRIGRPEVSHSIRSNLDPRANRAKPDSDEKRREEYVPSTVDKYLKSSMSKAYGLKYN